MNKKELGLAIKSLHFHQGQQLQMMELMEGIRWKFITAFGFGAGFAIFYASTKKATEQELNTAFILSLCVVGIVSIAALVTQIRIYSIVHSTWGKLHKMQSLETQLLNNKISSSLLKKELLFADMLPRRKSWAHLLTVHMSSCFVFCCFISISLVMLTGSISVVVNVSAFLIVTVLLLAFVWILTCWYISQAENE